LTHHSVQHAHNLQEKKKGLVATACLNSCTSYQRVSAYASYDDYLGWQAFYGKRGGGNTGKQLWDCFGGKEEAYETQDTREYGYREGFISWGCDYRYAERLFRPPFSFLERDRPGYTRPTHLMTVATAPMTSYPLRSAPLIASGRQHREHLDRMDNISV
jgi:hypothetical protein